jgi:hypothetical protein
MPKETVQLQLKSKQLETALRALLCQGHTYGDDILQQLHEKHYGSRLWLENGQLVGQQVRTVSAAAGIKLGNHTLLNRMARAASTCTQNAAGSTAHAELVMSHLKWHSVTLLHMLLCKLLHRLGVGCACL